MRMAVGIFCACLFLYGCGKQFEAGRQSSSGSGAQQIGTAGEDRPADPSAFASSKLNEPGDRTLALADAKAATAPNGEVKNPSETPSATDRKIIYIADVMLVVTDFSKTEKELPALVTRCGGYLADVSVDQSRGEHRGGRWVARIPAEKFEGFLDDLATLGVPEARHQTAQDVSEEYIDIEARIKNTKRLEDRILKLVDERSGNIREITELEQQLSRVREEIERMEGRLRYLANRTALTTVTITAREEHNFKPPETPTFATRVSASWKDSLVALQDSGERFAVGAVGAAPWIGVWGVILAPGMVWGLRRWKRS
jgi:uncharacterized coiled-coil protein SlyX